MVSNVDEVWISFKELLIDLIARILWDVQGEVFIYTQGLVRR